MTLLVETPQRLREPLPAAHRGARGHAADGREREPLPPALDSGAAREHARRARLPLRLRAPRARGPRPERGRPARARRFGRDRFFVELQRPYERGDARRNAALRELAETLGVADRRHRRRARAPPRRAALQDALVAIRCRTSLDGCERERRGNRESVLLAPDEMADRFPDDRDAVARTAELAERLEFDLTQELGYRYPDFSDGDEPADAPARARLRARLRRALRATPTATSAARAQRLDEELALIGELGLAGFFLLHWEVLELAREVALEVRGARLAAPRRCRPAAGAAARSARSSAT